MANSLTCNLLGVRFKEGVYIISTDYEIALDDKMDNIILYSYNDTVDRYMKVFDYEPEKGRTYYSRVRVLLNTGQAGWGPISELVYEKNNAQFYLSTPSPVNTPILTTPFWATEHPYTCFTVTGSPYEVIGNSKLERVEWFITELKTGKLVEHLTKRLDMYNFYVDVLLKFNTQYVISCIYYGDNDNVSLRGSKVIGTTEPLTIVGLDIVSVLTPTTVLKTVVHEFNVQHEWYLLDSRTNKLNSPESEVTNVSSFTIDHNLLEKGSVYLLQSREMTDKGRYSYVAFRTTPDEIFGLPATLPFKLGNGSGTATTIYLNSEKE